MPASHRLARRASVAGIRGARLYWRLAESLSPIPDSSEKLVHMGDGCALPIDPADYVSVNAYRGIYERPEIAILSMLIRQGDTVVDVGANIGYFAVTFSRLVGPKGRVLACEPSPLCLDRLKSACDGSGASNVKVLGTALGARSGSAPLAHYDEEQQLGLGSLQRDPGRSKSIDVPVSRLDDLLKAEAIREVDLIKIDVEGHEPEVLAGGWRLMKERRCRYCLLEVSPKLRPLRDYSQLLDELSEGYAVFRVGESGRLVSRPSLDPNWQSDRQVNLAIVRRDCISPGQGTARLVGRPQIRRAIASRR